MVSKKMKKAIVGKKPPESTQAPEPTGSSARPTEEETSPKSPPDEPDATEETPLIFVERQISVDVSG
jgi:hypothetical protein